MKKRPYKLVYKDGGVIDTERMTDDEAKRRNVKLFTEHNVSRWIPANKKSPASD